MASVLHLVVFRLNEQRYALMLDDVERVVRAAEVTPLPAVPPGVVGVLNIHGRVTPVFSLRQRFRLADRAIHPEDQFLIAHSPRRTVALHVDGTEGVIERSENDIAATAPMLRELAHIQGIAQIEDGLVLIQDLERLLSPEEEQRLDRALAKAGDAAKGS